MPPVHIAGVGISHLTGRVSASNIEALAISAGTKALLDAGVSYGDVKHCIAGFLGDDLKVSKRVFQSFGETGAPITKVECHSGMFIARQFIKSGTSDCVLVIGFDQVLQTLHAQPDCSDFIVGSSSTETMDWKGW